MSALSPSTFIPARKCFLNIRTFLLTISLFHQISPFNHILSFLLYFFNKNNIDERMRVPVPAKNDRANNEQAKTGGLYALQNKNIVSKYNKNLGFMECKKNLENSFINLQSSIQLIISGFIHKIIMRCKQFPFKFLSKFNKIRLLPFLVIKTDKM